jgi:hypothetical protein
LSFEKKFTFWKNSNKKMFHFEEVKLLKSSNLKMVQT